MLSKVRTGQAQAWLVKTTSDMPIVGAGNLRLVISVPIFHFDLILFIVCCSYCLLPHESCCIMCIFVDHMF